jgi:hypothetical protein
MLVRMGFLESDQLREALRIQEHYGRGQPLGALLLEHGFVSEEQLFACVEEQCVQILARVISAERGIFVYHRGATVPSGTEVVPLNADRIVLEATRRTDELATLRGLLPNESAPLMLSDLIDAVAETLSDAEVFVAAALQAGPASVSELGANSSTDELSLWRTIIGMRERGLIVAGDAPSLTFSAISTRTAR